MAWSLVGTIGAVSTAAGGTAVTPAWGTSENRTVGNTLICNVVGRASATPPTTPAGWTVLWQTTSATGTGASATIFGLIAAGGDAAPTIAALAGCTWFAQLAEYTGGPATLIKDQNGSATGTTSTLVATSAAADAASTDLVLSASIITHAAATAATVSNAFNNGTFTSTTNSGSSVVAQYVFSYCVAPTGNASADSNTFTFTTTPVAGITIIGSLQLAAASLPSRVPVFLPRQLGPGAVGPTFFAGVQQLTVGPPPGVWIPPLTFSAPRNKVFPLVRGRKAVPVPPQEAPILQGRPKSPRREPMRLMRGRQVTPVPPQQNPTIQIPRIARPFRWLAVRRGRQVTPVPAQVVVVASPWIPPKLGVAKRLAALARGRRTALVPDQLSPPPLPVHRPVSRALAPVRARRRSVVDGQITLLLSRRAVQRVPLRVSARRQRVCIDTQPLPLGRRTTRPRIVRVTLRHATVPVLVAGSGPTYSDLPIGALVFIGTSTEIYSPPQPVRQIFRAPYEW